MTISIVFNNMSNNYLIFQQARPTQYSVLSGKLIEKDKQTELKS